MELLIFLVVLAVVLLSSWFVSQRVHRLVKPKLGKRSIIVFALCYIVCFSTMSVAVVAAAVTFIPFGR